MIRISKRCFPKLMKMNYKLKPSKENYKLAKSWKQISKKNNNLILLIYGVITTNVPRLNKKRERQKMKRRKKVKVKRCKVKYKLYRLCKTLSK